MARITHIGHRVGLLGPSPVSRAPLRAPVPRARAHPRIASGPSIRSRVLKHLSTAQTPRVMLAQFPDEFAIRIRLSHRTSRNCFSGQRSRVRGESASHDGILALRRGTALGERHDAIVPDLGEQREIHGIGGMKNHVCLVLEVGEADLHRHAFMQIVQRLFEGLSVAAQIHFQGQCAPLAVLVESDDAHGHLAYDGHPLLLQFPAVMFSLAASMSGWFSAHASMRG